MADRAAAGGALLSNPDQGMPKPTSAAATPANAFELTFGGVAPPIYFEQTGQDTIRIQVREDGLSIDQGTVITASVSADGSSWTPLGSDTLPADQYSQASL